MTSDIQVPMTGTQLFWAICSGVGLVSVGWASSHVTGRASFVSELWETWSALTVALDLLFLGVAVIAFVVIEAHRLGMRAPWLWAVLAVLLPGAFLVPLFFLFRERRLLRMRA